MGRSTQGVKVMNIKDDDRVSAVALAAESDDDVDIPAAGPTRTPTRSRSTATEVDPSVNGASEDGARPESDDVERVSERRGPGTSLTTAGGSSGPPTRTPTHRSAA